MGYSTDNDLKAFPFELEYGFGWIMPKESN